MWILCIKFIDSTAQNRILRKQTNKKLFVLQNNHSYAFPATILDASS